MSLEKVEYGKTCNWLKFYCYTPWIDINRLFDFEYCGTELVKNNLILIDNQEKDLLKKLHKIFGMPPFDLDRAKTALENNRSIEL